MKIFNTKGEFILETKSASLLGANLSGANLSGANFRYADLSNVNFRDANLRGADLRGANLRGADLIILQMDLWTAYITADHISIGCQSYTLSEWENFTDEEISNMHSKALDYWTKNKEIIISLCKRFNNKVEIEVEQND